ncbi:MAG: cellulase family glycosylhydrolase [Kiritimatiellae bacterium]|nr:cellulase family glycosylhydrolase [Kiritimatiellia bacterium]
MRAKVVVVAVAAAVSAVCAAEGDARFPFVVSYGGADNASSVAHLLDAPAGKHGFVRVVGHEFVTDAGPIRFNGTNLTGPANFPEHDVADRLAARFARLGINCVRLHFMDTWYKNFMDTRRQCILDDDAKTQRKLSPAQLDKLDYLIAAFKKRGIYVNMNLHVGRTLDARDGVPAGSPWANKTVGQFYPRCIELQKEYARDLLTHVNKYTGNAYTDEPAVAMIEISNEDRGLVVTRRHMGIKKLAKPFQDELERQWNEWLKKKYGGPLGERALPGKTRPSYANGKAPLLNKFPKASAKFRKDFDDFLWDNELAYWKGMRDYIRETLKAKSPVSGTQAGSHYSPREIQAQLDYVDAHAYFHHPSGKGRGWIVKNSTNEWVAGGESLVHGLSTLTNLETKSHAPAKPFTVSEYSHPYPSPFTGEGQPLACAYGRTMGWDGIFQYSYNHFPEAFEPEGLPWCIFDAIATPSVWVHSPACAAMMVRGDLRADRAQKLGEFIWNRDRPGKEYVAVNTKNSKLFVGYADGREITLGDVSLKVGATETGAAVISLVSRNATGFGAEGAASILVAASGVAANTGAKIERVSEKLVRLPERGHAPVCAEGIPCEITLPAPPARVKCWALAGDGSRMKEIAPEAVGDGKRSRIRLTPSCRTLWYEVDL